MALRLGSGSARRAAGAAWPLLIIRLLEGAIAIAALIATPRGLAADWRIAGGAIAYVTFNLAVCCHYRRADGRRWVVGLDVAVNAFALAACLVASGGLLSPLVPLLALRVISYALVWGPSTGAAAALTSLGMALAASAGGWAVQTLTPDDVGLSREALIAAAVAQVIVSGVLAVLWLGRTRDANVALRVSGASDPSGGPAAATAALVAASEALGRRPWVDDALATVAAIAPSAIGADQCEVALWEENGRYYRCPAAAPSTAPQASQAEPRLAAEEVGALEWARRLGHCVAASARDGPLASEASPRSVLIAPLASGGRFFGGLKFMRRDGRTAFTHRDMRVAEGIAAQIAMALECNRLAAEGQRLARALESSDEAVLVTDDQRRITFANAAFLRTLGLPRSAVIGRDAAELAAAVAEPLAVFQATLPQRSWRGETTLQRGDGTAIPIQLNASLVRDIDGRVQGAVAMVEDLTEEQRRREHLQRADRLAAVGQTAAGMAHEINNALTAILGQTADSAALPVERLRDALARVEVQAHRIGAILQGALDFARPHPPHFVPVDVASLTARTLELVRHDLERDRIRVEIALPPDLPLVEADPQQIQQVLLNLFVNAIHAMAGRSDGRLCVTGACQGDQLALRIVDSGAGIDPTDLGRIFDPFFSTKAEGSGLGLSISYAIARAHRGDLRVDSLPGQGATFTLLLPVAAAGAPAAVERALLVDDDPDVAEALMAMLAKEGLRVTRAATAAEGMSLLEAEAWDAVFLDIRLPDLPGPEVYRRLAESNDALAQRVVFVSGSGWRSGSHLRQELPRPVLSKPCTQEQVRDMVRQLRAARPAAA